MSFFGLTKIDTPVTATDTTTNFGSPTTSAGFSFGQPISTTTSVSASATTIATTRTFGLSTAVTGGFSFGQPASTSASTVTTLSHGTPTTTTANFSLLKFSTDTTKEDTGYFGTGAIPKFNFGSDDIDEFEDFRKPLKEIVRRRAENKKRDSRNSFKVSTGGSSRVDTSTQTEEPFRMKKFMQGINDLFDTGKFSDVTLNVKGKEFRVHRSVLAAHSPVFAAMMEHETKEKESGVVDIEDAEPDIFADFLHILYSGSTENINRENVIDLYTVADKYEVTELSSACVAYMIEHISVENFCDITALSLRHHEKELREVVTDYFLKNSIVIAETAKWLVFLKENTVAGNEMFLKALKLKKR